jgi:hypothetical protein
VLRRFLRNPYIAHPPSHSKSNVAEALNTRAGFPVFGFIAMASLLLLGLGAVGFGALIAYVSFCEKI